MSLNIKRNIESVQQQVVWLNEKDIDGFLSCLAQDFVWMSDVLPRPTVGIDGARQGLTEVYSVFPDIHFEEEVIYPSGETVIGVFKVSGTQVTPGPGALLPAVRNHPWYVNQAIFHTFNPDGKMSMVWLFTNAAFLMQQLGVLPKDLTTFGAPDAPNTAQQSPFAQASMPFPGAPFPGSPPTGASSPGAFFPEMPFPGAPRVGQSPFQNPGSRQESGLSFGMVGEVMMLPIKILYEGLRFLENLTKVDSSSNRWKNGL